MTTSTSGAAALRKYHPSNGYDDDELLEGEIEDETERLQRLYPRIARYTDPVVAPAREIVGRDQEIQRLMAAMHRPEVNNALLLAPAGAGKSHPNDTMIAVADDRGYVSIGQLVVGDEVFSEAGEPIAVTGVYPQGTKEVYRVHFADGTSTLCNDEHLWNVRTTQDRVVGAAYRTLTVAQVLETPHEVWSIPLNEGLQRDAVDFAVDPATVGRRLATEVQELDTRVRIPAEYYLGSIQQRRDLLDGFVGAWPEGSMLSFHIESQGLAYDLQHLMTSVGHRVYVDTETVIDTVSLIPVYIDQVFEGGKYHGSTQVEDLVIESIEHVGCSVEQTCIEVESPTHLYQVGYNHVVTHNTALVQAAMLRDTKRKYLEVDVSRMIAQVDTADQMAAELKAMFDEAEGYSRDEDQELILFMDEFHQLVQLSAAAVEALKPVLAASGARGIKVIAATTLEEFHQHIASNLPLVERLQRINIDAPDRETTITILKGMAERYGVGNMIIGDQIYEQIYDYTQRLQPASTQPRKSILVLDAMVGWHELTGQPMDTRLLADVLQDSLNVNVAFSVDASQIEKTLNERVISQKYATRIMSDQLQLSVAGLNDPTKPMASFLMVGSTGTGKSELSKQLALLLFDDRDNLIRFDMTEYSLESSVEDFRSELAKAVWNKGHAVILFDEIEKAAANVSRLLLQVLDDGRISDDFNRQVSFLNCYIVLTSNAGAEIFENLSKYSPDDEGSGEAFDDMMSQLRTSITTTTGDNRFPPEFLGRIDQIVPFQPLSRETQRKIVYNKMAEMRQRVMRKHGVSLDFHPRVLQFIVDDQADTSSKAGGARRAINLLNNEVMVRVAEFINKYASAHTKGRKVTHIIVTVQGEMWTDSETRRESSAYIEVFEDTGQYDYE